MPALLLLLAALAAGPAAAEPEPALEFLVSGASSATVPLSALKAAVKSRRISFPSPFSDPPGKLKTYEAFALRDLLDYAFGRRWLSPEYSHVAFVARDGYAAVGALAKADEDGGFVAFRDLDVASGWEPVGGHGADPGPFFVVWTGTRQTTADQYPWPWQVTALNLIRFEDQYPRTAPRGAAPGSPERRGYALFQGRCVRCHSVNGEGGKIGPDLNEPMSVTAYRSKRMVKEFIREPSRYRHTYMPDHRDLSERDLEDLWRYFRWLDGHRPKGDGW
jgi:mono/diheme cytochrome c family protein